MITKTLTAVVLSAVSITTTTSAMAEKMDEKQKISYAIGLDIGKNLIRQKIDIDADAFQQGMLDSLHKNKPQLSEQELLAAKRALQAGIQKKQAELTKVKSDKNIADGKAFIKKFSKEKDVVALDNGILYKVLKAGNGASPTLEDKVVAHYTGKLVDGQVFDSSVQRGEPSTFPLKNVIQGWQQILPMMKVGSKWQVVIPPQMAYGERGAGGKIGPDATLVFEIELIEIKSKV